MLKDTNLFLKYVGPSIIGMLIGGSFSIVDTVFIGQASGKIGLAAVALTWPVVMMLMTVGQLIGAGGAVLIAQAEGAADLPKTQRLFFRNDPFSHHCICHIESHHFSPAVSGSLLARRDS